MVSPFLCLYLLSGLVAWAYWRARTIAQLLGPSVWLQTGNGSDGEEEGKESRRKRGVVVKENSLRGEEKDKRILNKRVWKKNGVNGFMPPPPH